MAIIDTRATRSNKSSKADTYLPKNADSPIISLRLLCDDIYIITIDKQEISIQKNGKYIIKGTRKKKTGMWEVSLGPQQYKNLVNNILEENSKSELAQYLFASLFIPTAAILLKAIKQCFLKTWTGLTEKLIKKHLDK